ncbi:MAG: heavy metal-binding domain-containing protein, partial [Methanobrevibacter sp.]|nr:heavy metal-binding domain-containing protein [Methanobrevibacter sp.]
SEELEAARDEAFKAMEDKAKELGANGIIGLKISYNNLGGTMGNTILVTVYGTAVSYK